MTLDKRIQKDLKELYNGGATPGVIQDASGLNDLIQAKSGQTSFATKALPGYYTGCRDAKTVMVMLNPGIDVDEANANLKCDICKRSMTNAGDVVGYHNSCANYGHWDKLRQDNFDLKQAFFLHKWKNTGISFPTGFCANPKSNKQILLDAKEAVLTQKLQLELIPYASSSFSSFNPKKINLVFPFVETLFDEIFRVERTYVIFASAKFENLFNKYNEKSNNIFDIPKIGNTKQLTQKLSGQCKIIKIKYKGKSRKALIANTFPHQALPNAYKLMEEYGEFCYNCFINCP